MNNDNNEANAQNASNSTNLDGPRLGKLESINADLLEALRAALAFIEKEVADAEADLSPAERQSRAEIGPCEIYSVDSGRGENEINLAAIRAAIAKATEGTK